MEFRLTYKGPLKSNGGPKDKQPLRRHFHLQLRELVERRSMAHFKRLIEKKSPNATFIDVGGFKFVPLITERLNYVARLNITLLTPEEPGRAITQGGDLDNRLKTLLDALRAPKVPTDIPAGDVPGADEDPFYCVLEDDSLISAISVTADRLLRPGTSPSTVLLLIHVVPESTLGSIGTATWTIE